MMLLLINQTSLDKLCNSIVSGYKFEDSRMLRQLIIATAIWKLIVPRCAFFYWSGKVESTPIEVCTILIF
jgi:hypothetical protein